MKLRTPCIVCLQTPSNEEVRQIAFGLAAINDRGMCYLKCPHGHEYVVVIHGTKYEVLYDIALNALHDGYYREAISSFAAGLERFFEFFLRTLFHFTKQSALFDKNWKIVKTASERQLGAYVLCSALYFGCEARVLGAKFVTLRNDVIHKGYIPGLQETLDFGQEICDVIVAGLDFIYAKHGDDFRDFYYKQMPQPDPTEKPTLQYAMVGIRWEDVKQKDSTLRHVRKAYERMFGPIG